MKKKTFQQIVDMTESEFEKVWTQRRSVITNALSEEYGLHRDLVTSLAVLDSTAWQGSQNATIRRRVDSLKKKIMARFAVVKKNYGILELMAGGLGDLSGRRYLDVGCGMGFALHHARNIGFERADGLEINKAFFKRSEVVCNHFDDQNVRSYLSDFLTHEFDFSYDLITFFDVFEHIKDRDLALKRAHDLLTDDGVIFVYQGNYQSSEIVRVEPHYRVPGLTLLGRDRQIEILLSMGKISKPENFAVNDWPNFDLFRKNPDFNCFLNPSGKNIRGNRLHLDYDTVYRRIRNMATQPKIWNFPQSDRLAEADRLEIISALNALSERIEHDMDTYGIEEVYSRYLIGSWELILTRRSHEVNVPGFEKIS